MPIAWLKLNHVSKRGHGYIKLWHCRDWNIPTGSTWVKRSKLRSHTNHLAIDINHADGISGLSVTYFLASYPIEAEWRIYASVN